MLYPYTAPPKPFSRLVTGGHDAFEPRRSVRPDSGAAAHICREISYERNVNKEMKFNFKRFLAFVLALVMVFSYVPAGAFATGGNVAEVNGTEYATLAEAVAAAGNGATVTLLADAAGAGVVIDKSVTIDFGGHTYTFTEGEVGGGDEPNPEEPVVEQITLVVGDNNVEVTKAILANQGVDAILVIETEGNYTFRGDFFVQIYNELGMMVGNGTAYLTPGTYTVKLGTFLLSGAGTYGLVVELEVPEEPEEPEEPDVPTGDPDGTQANPYVITSLPMTVVGTGNHDLYYTYTAENVTKMQIFYTEGGFVTFSGEYMDWDKDEGAMMYVVVVDAGQTLIINPWGSVDATYEITGGGKK